MKEFAQKFRKTVKESGYKRRLLVEKFKQEMNGTIRKKLIKTE